MRERGLPLPLLSVREKGDVMDPVYIGRQVGFGAHLTIKKEHNKQGYPMRTNKNIVTGRMSELCRPQAVPCVYILDSLGSVFPVYILGTGKLRIFIVKFCLPFQVCTVGWLTSVSV